MRGKTGEGGYCGRSGVIEALCAVGKEGIGIGGGVGLGGPFCDVGGAVWGCESMEGAHVSCELRGGGICSDFWSLALFRIVVGGEDILRISDVRNSVV